MMNFEFYLPTKAIFGKGSIAEIPKKKLIPEGSRVMLVYGGGSIKSNGVYEQITSAVMPLCEFGGIEPNPSHETCMKAVKVALENKVDFLLAVGGGSVIDATKYIVCAMAWDKTPDPYDIMLKWGFGGNPEFEPKAKVPFGCVLTIPAAGSESNMGSVISHRERKLKLPFKHYSCFPVFAVLDPEVTYSLPKRQKSNGIIDAYVHAFEQYCCHYNVGRLQDRQCEGIMCSLKEIAPVVLSENNYAAAADFVWSSTQALNGLIGCGVPQCWVAHLIGHEITAFYGLDHGQTLALTVPAVMKFQKEVRAKKHSQYAERVFGYKGPDAHEKAITLTEEFFESLGVHTRLSKYGMDDKHFQDIAKRFPNTMAPEKNIDSAAIMKILQSLL